MEMVDGGDRRAGRDRLGRRKVRVLEDELKRRSRGAGGGASPKMKNFMKAKIRRAIESCPRKKAAKAFILRGKPERVFENDAPQDLEKRIRIYKGIFV